MPFSHAEGNVTDPYTHPEYVEFLAKICAEPDEDTHRLVFADWVEENGDPDRAEFVRCQFAGGTHAPARAQRLMHTHYDTPDGPQNWGRRAGALGVVYPAPLVLFARGFVREARVPVDSFLKIADGLLWRPDYKTPCGRCGGDGNAHGADRAFEWSGDPMYRKCPACRGSGRVTRPCPPTAQPVAGITLTNWAGYAADDAGLSRFNAVRKWVEPMTWAGDVVDTLAAEWPWVRFGVGA